MLSGEERRDPKQITNKNSISRSTASHVDVRVRQATFDSSCFWSELGEVFFLSPQVDLSEGGLR